MMCRRLQRRAENVRRNVATSGDLPTAVPLKTFSSSGELEMAIFAMLLRKRSPGEHKVYGQLYRILL